MLTDESSSYGTLRRDIQGEPSRSVIDAFLPCFDHYPWQVIHFRHGDYTLTPRSIDIFRSNRHDSNISDTSSYLDLAPLYGSSVADQAKIRTFRNGMLKPDTYFEERLLAQPPGINVMLVLYSRYHNFVADMILKINEGGRFNLKPGPEAEALKQQDEDLFQTARL